MLSSLFSLEGKVALVTGGTRGIGGAIATGLAQAGADVILVQRESASTQTYEEIKKIGKKTFIIHAELDKREQVDEIVPKAIEISPTNQIDILVNCAGIQRRSPSHKFSTKDWDDVIQVNLTAPFILAREVGAHMIEKNIKGKIINIASLITFQGGITIPAYAASKGGIGQFTKTLSNEWASKGINVNAIAPGYIETEMNTGLISDPVRSKQILERIPAGRWGKPEDFVGPAVFLASSSSNYVDGEILVVDGGWMGR